VCRPLGHLGPLGVLLLLRGGAAFPATTRFLGPSMRYFIVSSSIVVSSQTRKRETSLCDALVLMFACVSHQYSPPSGAQTGPNLP